MKRIIAALLLSVLAAFAVAQNSGSFNTVSRAILSSFVVGVTDGTSASAGRLGEAISNSASAQNAPTATQQGDCTSISLTPGDWDVSGAIEWTQNGSTFGGGMSGGISSTSGNSTTGMTAGVNLLNGPPPAGTYNSSVSIPSYRVSITTTTTHYLKMQANYSAGTPLASCSIRARRER